MCHCAGVGTLEPAGHRGHQRRDWTGIDPCRHVLGRLADSEMASARLRCTCHDNRADTSGDRPEHRHHRGLKDRQRAVRNGSVWRSAHWPHHECQVHAASDERWQSRLHGGQRGPRGHTQTIPELHAGYAEELRRGDNRRRCGSQHCRLEAQRRGKCGLQQRRQCRPLRRLRAGRERALPRRRQRRFHEANREQRGRLAERSHFRRRGAELRGHRGGADGRRQRRSVRSQRQPAQPAVRRRRGRGLHRPLRRRHRRRLRRCGQPARRRRRPHRQRRVGRPVRRQQREAEPAPQGRRRRRLHRGRRGGRHCR